MAAIAPYASRSTQRAYGAHRADLLDKIRQRFQGGEEIATKGTAAKASAVKETATKDVRAAAATDKANNASSTELTQDQEAQVRELKTRDAEVRAHEAAHLGAAGGHANGGASYSYQEGPDGRRYAVGGEVSVSTSPVSGDPAATIQKARTIRAAAMAPANPSGQDRSVAAGATAMESKARAQMAEQRAEEAAPTEKPEIPGSSEVSKEMHAETTDEPVTKPGRSKHQAGLDRYSQIMKPEHESGVFCGACGKTH
ncbi:MAG: hypothetical protein ACI9WU_003131 [Myxococcota bacterium]|jgi:hypothetical protein